MVTVKGRNILSGICIVFLSLLITHCCSSNISKSCIKHSIKIDIAPEITLLSNINKQNLFINTIWQKIGNEYDIDPYLLYSIAIIESRKSDKKNVYPWPYALHVNKTGKSYYPGTRENAERILFKILQVTDDIDIGLMQINYHWHKDKIEKPTDLLDPEVNLKVAAKILSRTLKSSQDIILGIGRYHSWINDRAYKYGNKVYLLYTAIKNHAREEDYAGEG